MGLLAYWLWSAQQWLVTVNIPEWSWHQHDEEHRHRSPSQWAGLPPSPHRTRSTAHTGHQGSGVRGQGPVRFYMGNSVLIYTRIVWERHVSWFQLKKCWECSAFFCRITCSHACRKHTTRSWCASIHRAFPFSRALEANVLWLRSVTIKHTHSAGQNDQNTGVSSR